MIISEKNLGRKSNGGIHMSKGTFVFNYDGPYRSDLKESHKAHASTEVMDKIADELYGTEKLKRQLDEELEERKKGKSMDRETIESIAEKYGFTLWSINNASTLQFMDSRGINLLVYENGDYELKWMIPHTFFTIECPKCSPFGSEHFEKMLAKFRIEVTFRSFQEVEDGD